MVFTPSQDLNLRLSWPKVANKIASGDFDCFKFVLPSLKPVRANEKETPFGEILVKHASFSCVSFLKQHVEYGKVMDFVACYYCRCFFDTPVLGVPIKFVYSDSSLTIFMTDILCSIECIVGWLKSQSETSVLYTHLGVYMTNVRALNEILNPGSEITYPNDFRQLLCNGGDLDYASWKKTKYTPSQVIQFNNQINSINFKSAHLEFLDCEESSGDESTIGE